MGCIGHAVFIASVGIPGPSIWCELTSCHNSLEWFKGKFTANPPIFDAEKPWFPVKIFPTKPIQWRIHQCHLAPSFRSWDQAFQAEIGLPQDLKLWKPRSIQGLDLGPCSVPPEKKEHRNMRRMGAYYHHQVPAYPGKPFTAAMPVIQCHCRRVKVHSRKPEGGSMMIPSNCQ